MADMGLRPIPHWLIITDSCGKGICAGKQWPDAGNAEPVISAREAGSRFVSEYMLSRDALGGRHPMAGKCGLLFLPAKPPPIGKTAETAGPAPKAAIQFARKQMPAYSLLAVRINPILKISKGVWGAAPCLPTALDLCRGSAEKASPLLPLSPFPRK